MTANSLRRRRFPLRALACFAAFAASVHVPREALGADASAAAAAEALFGEGKRLVQEGSFAAACPKFEESQRLDPGLGTLYRLADCYEHTGRTASAWAAFLEVASGAKKAGQDARAEDAKKRADGLAPRLSRLVVAVAEPNLEGLVVKRGKVDVGRGQWNTPIPVDPGTIELEASAPGKKPWAGTVTVGERATERVEVPRLAAAPVVNGGLTTPPPAEPARSGLGAQRTVALALGVGGLVGLGVGTAFGLSSMSKGSDADGHCDASNVCDQQGVTLRHDAVTAGDVSTIAFIAGGALAAGAAVLWFTAPTRATTTSAASRAPRVGLAPRVGGLSLQVELP